MNIIRRFAALVARLTAGAADGMGLPGVSPCLDGHCATCERLS
jgi:hypothetical protein